MEFGIFGVGDLASDPRTGTTPTEHERIHGIARVARHAEEVGFDVVALGEHHNPPFVTSATSTLLAYVAAQTERVTLSTSTTLITTNDPVKIAEDFATLQHLASGRVDLMLGRGNTPAVYPWFGQDVRDGLALALENYALLRRLWDEEVVTWQGQFRAPLAQFTAMPRPLGGTPPPVWHGSIRSPEIAEQAAFYGDGFFVNNLFMDVSHFRQYVELYRARWEHYGHGPGSSAIVGAGGAIYVRRSSQEARAGVRPHFHNSLLGSNGRLEDAIASTGLAVGSPDEVVEKVLTFRDAFGPYQRQLFNLDFGGVPEQAIHEELDLIGEAVLPVLRRELDAPAAASAMPLDGDRR